MNPIDFAETNKVMDQNTMTENTQAVLADTGNSERPRMPIILLLGLGLGLACSGPAPAAADDFRACGSDFTDALRNLSSKISTTIQDTRREIAESKDAEAGGVRFMDTTRKVASTFFRSTSAIFDGLEETAESTREGAATCLSVTRANLVKTTERLQKLADSYDLKLLPEEPRQRAVAIDSWLRNIRTLSTYGSLFHKLTPARSRQLLALAKSLEDLRAETFTASVEFQTGAQRIQMIEVDGRETALLPGDRLYLGAGKHSFKVIQEGQCDYVGEFTVSEEESRIVSVPWEGREIPELTVSYKTVGSSSLGSEPMLMINGTEHAFGKPWSPTPASCETVADWKITWERGTDSSQVKMAPGRKKNISRSLASTRFVQEVDEANTRLLASETTKYGLSYEPILSAASAESGMFHSVRVDVLNFRNEVFHFGYGGLFGNRDQKFRFSIDAKAGLSLPRWGKDPILIFGGMNLIPWIRVEAGLGYTDHTPAVAADGFNLTQNILGIGAKAGALIPINPALSIDFQVGKLFTLDQGWSAGLGLMFVP